MINLAEMRAKLRPAPPPEPLISSLTRALANIDAAFASNGTPTDG
ncbi:hypothetical protein [Bradyrhizobium sp. dw_78]|nr:hypothetical protein [Bradyrhizobium sp. dw_78]